MKGRTPNQGASKREQRTVAGARRGDRGPAFAAGGLAPPKWFKAAELEEWARIVPELQRVGVARGIHQGALEGICMLYASGRSLMKAGDVRGARLAANAYRLALGDFGLTPATAGRVGILGGTGARDDDDPGGEFFGGPRLA